MGTPQSRKRKRRPSGRPAPKKRPVLAMLIFLCLAVGLGYFLAQISGTAEQTQPAPVKVKPKKLTVKEPLPEKPQEVWQYPQDLKEKEVIVEIPKTTRLRYSLSNAMWLITPAGAGRINESNHRLSRTEC